MELTGRKGKTRGKRGITILFRDQGKNESRSITVKGIDLNELYNRTYIFYSLLESNYKILVESDKNDPKI